VFDLYFMPGARPYLVPLAVDEPSPFAPSLKGRAIGDEGKKDDGDRKGHSGHSARNPAQSRVDVEGLAGRIVPFPVPAGNYSHLTAAKGGVAMPVAAKKLFSSKRS